MFRNLSKTVFGLVGLALSLSIFSMPAISTTVDYGIVYVRAPRFGDQKNSLWPEVFHPARLDPGADLMLLHPDGSEEVLVVWTIFGRRLDGWTNADHPTEFKPGNPSGLPAGVDLNATDLDYTGTIMPPPGSNVPPLGEDEKITIARWIDLGCLIDIRIFLKVRRE